MPHDGRVGVGLGSRFLPVEDFFSSRALASSLGFFRGQDWRISSGSGLQAAARVQRCSEGFKI